MEGQIGRDKEAKMERDWERGRRRDKGGKRWRDREKRGGS
jgi:hypothetical protein